MSRLREVFWEVIFPAVVCVAAVAAVVRIAWWVCVER